MEAGSVDVKLGLDSKGFKQGIQEAEKKTQGLTKSISKMGQSFGLSQKASDMLAGSLTKLIGGASVIGITKKLIDMGKAAIQTSAQFEQLGVSFEVMAGGAEAGKKLTNQIIELASKTPLTTEALSDGARTLLSFGEAATDVIEDLKLLGDITGGDTQRMQSLTLAFAQVGSTGRLMGQDLMQMVNAGFNPLQIMSEKTGKSMATLKDEMAKGKISFNDVKQAMVEATSEGGRFYGMMNKQSQTLEGRLSTLSDTWSLVSKNIGDFFLPAAKACVSALNAIGEAILKVQTKLDNVSKRINYQTPEAQKKLVDGLQKESEKYIELATKYEKRGNKQLAESYRKQARDFEEASKRRLAKYNEAIKKEKELSQKVETGFAFTSATGDTSKSSSKKAQDEALKAYKKYIEDFKKLNNNYQATLKAAEYIENTLGINPITQKESYDELLSLYANYISRSQEIAQSGAKNKSELLKRSEEQLQNDLSAYRLNKERETERKLYDMIKGFQDERKEIEYTKQAEQSMGGFLGSYGTGYNEKLSLLKWYYKQRETIANEHYATMEAKQAAFNELEQTTALKASEIERDIWKQRGADITSTFNQTFDSLLTNYGDFSDNMKQLVLNLSRYILKEMLQSSLAQLSSLQTAQGGVLQGFTNMFSTATNAAGGLNNITNSATTAQGAMFALSATQTAMAPVSKVLASTTKSSAKDYATMAATAQQAAISVAQLAIAQAASSVAQIPLVGGFLAPVAATLTGAAIAAATAMVAGSGIIGAGASKLGGVISGGTGGGTTSGVSPAPVSNADLPTYHSGGLVPGTKEQLALLKGGERVLNPAQNASYTNGEDTIGDNSVNNIMMFNIKAWDGKDVIKTLQANSQTINQIVSSGIKNNNQGLRSTVQNV